MSQPGFHSHTAHTTSHLPRAIHFVLTGVTARAVGRPRVHTRGAGVVAQVTPATRLVLPTGASHHTAALIQSPAAGNINITKSTHMNYKYVNELNSFKSQRVPYGAFTQM